MPKATVEAPSNIAFIKYWGAKDLDEAIPAGPSLSMTLQRCASRTTAVFHEGEDGPDEVLVAHNTDDLAPAGDAFRRPIVRHLRRLCKWAGRHGRFQIATRNSFPSSAGLASSASGFAALTLAVLRAFGVAPDRATQSVLARQSGSGSAARSVMGGYVAWPEGDRHAARQVAPHDHWDLRDVIALVETAPKKVASRDGHRRANTSPFFEKRLSLLPERMQQAAAAIETREFEALGEVIETDGVELHLITMSSVPPIFYWMPATLAVLEAVRELRAEGVPAYSTMDAGANVHVICEPHHEEQVARRLSRVDGVLEVIRDRVGPGPRTDVEPLL